MAMAALVSTAGGGSPLTDIFSCSFALTEHNWQDLRMFYGVDDYQIHPLILLEEHYYCWFQSLYPSDTVHAR